MRENISQNIIFDNRQKGFPIDKKKNKTTNPI